MRLIVYQLTSLSESHCPLKTLNRFSKPEEELSTARGVARTDCPTNIVAAKKTNLETILKMYAKRLGRWKALCMLTWLTLSHSLNEFIPSSHYALTTHASYYF
jgi:hypothetical protein